MRSGLMYTVAEPYTKGRDAARTASRPLTYVCIWRMCAPGVLSLGAVSMFSAAGVRLPHQRSCFYQL